jgi:phosphomannomutase
MNAGKLNWPPGLCQAAFGKATTVNQEIFRASILHIEVPASPFELEKPPLPSKFDEGIMKLSIKDLMSSSGVAFGTSGARGLATAMTDLVCYAYTRGFLQYLEAIGELKRAGARVAVGGDFRPSTDRVMAAVMQAAEDMGYAPVNCGKTPSPAVALFGLTYKIPAIMVTGSHIPDDRNGIKFNKCVGEVLKSDEPGIASQFVEVDDDLFDDAGGFAARTPAPRIVSEEAEEAYIQRYLNVFGPAALSGLRIAAYQHSAVGRDVLVRIMAGLGAQVTPLGRSEKFIPVDTEAIRPEDVELARQWAGQPGFDAIVSADGDSDRPLVGDEHGEWLRGDVAGILCAKFLGADSVSTPVSCNTAVEKCGWFPEIRRTRIGSPYVIVSLQEARARGALRVVGYEANGGFLLNSDIALDGKILGALPTRDAVIVMLGILLLARREGKTVSALAATLPSRSTASDRIKDFPTEKSTAIIAQFNTGDKSADQRAVERVFGGISGAVTALDRTDGLRCTFANEEIIHLRPSGNAPELRCYTEAASDARAREMNAAALAVLQKIVGTV